ncbi:hypothetical protein AAC387_Pa01g2486 [Persea americana]
MPARRLKKPTEDPICPGEKQSDTLLANPKGDPTYPRIKLRPGRSIAATTRSTSPPPRKEKSQSSKTSSIPSTRKPGKRLRERKQSTERS